METTTSNDPWAAYHCTRKEPHEPHTVHVPIDYPKAPGLRYANPNRIRTIGFSCPGKTE